MPGLFLFLFKLGMPGGKLHQLFIRSVIVPVLFVEFCDFRHFFFGEGEIQDVQVVFDMADILASRDHREAHLGMPAEDDLGRGLPVFLPQLRKDRFFDQGFVAVAEGVPGHQPDIIPVQGSPKFLLSEVGMCLNLNKLGDDLPFGL